eukprot:2184686-Amphidinium_carterae.1
MDKLRALGVLTRNMFIWCHFERDWNVGFWVTIEDSHDVRESSQRMDLRDHCMTQDQLGK